MLSADQMQHQIGRGSAARRGDDLGAGDKDIADELDVRKLFFKQVMVGPVYGRFHSVQKPGFGQDLRTRADRPERRARCPFSPEAVQHLRCRMALNITARDQEQTINVLRGFKPGMDKRHQTVRAGGRLAILTGQ